MMLHMIGSILAAMLIDDDHERRNSGEGYRRAAEQRDAGRVHDRF